MRSSCGQYSLIATKACSGQFVAAHMSDYSDTARSTRRTDGFLLRDFVRAATKALETNQDTINALNVFPVPDGDTGTNMVLTMRSIRDELERQIDANPSITSARMARAALLGARGNSGLILAQYFKGLAESLADGYEVSGQGFARGMRIASEIAYRAVPEPKEGTMLTVFRECADASEKAVSERPGLEHVMQVAADQAMDTVRRTPEMLDVLRNAGVVDSGGFGFAIMLKSGTDVLAGRETWSERIDPPGAQVQPGAVSLTGIRAEFLEGVEEEAWGYCTVFAIEGTNLDPEAVRQQMAGLGRSPVVAGSDTVLKVHVHMEDPGMALSAGLKLGSLSNIDIHNMDEQAREWASGHSGTQAQSETEPEDFITAIVAVAIGDGFTELFKNAGLGAVQLLAGGDSMNPSTAEIVEAIDRAPSDSVIVLPNNKNVIGTAQQAAELIENKKVEVLETRSMQAGLAALLEFSLEREITDNVQQMNEAIPLVRTGSVSIAQRDALIDGVAVRLGQHMGVLDEKLVAAGETAVDVLHLMLDGQVDEESLITLYPGAGTTDEVIEESTLRLSRLLPGSEVEILHGGQPGSDFLLSIE